VLPLDAELPNAELLGAVPNADPVLLKGILVDLDRRAVERVPSVSAAAGDPVLVLGGDVVEVRLEAAAPQG
jgi:hypothetical protein